jgi:hypothetical protein
MAAAEFPSVRVQVTQFERKGPNPQGRHFPKHLKFCVFQFGRPSAHYAM